MNSTSFSGKVVLVTGGSRGIGKAIAIAFADAGARVVITYKHDDKTAEEALNSLSGGPHMRVKADVTDTRAIEELFSNVIHQFGRIDVLVNNAGIFQHHRVQDDNPETWRQIWDRTIAVNLTGTANMCYYAAKQMMKQGSGRIINISSRGAFRGEPDSPGYGASKAGMNSLSQSLAIGLAPYNIYVGVVAPGWVETDMTKAILDGPEGALIRAQSPLNRTGKPEEVAHAVLMLASPGAEYMTGCIIDVNGASYLRS
jgi:3-oxoacyl-[acyl-carrier protein] reductase